jgi:hypothetical protein
MEDFLKCLVFSVDYNVTDEAAALHVMMKRHEPLLTQ